MTNLQQFVDLEARKRELENELKAVENLMKTLEESILDEWTQNGQTGAKIGGYTLYVNRQLWAGAAKGKEGVDVAAALGESGMAWLATANWQKLSAWVRELDQQGEYLPAPLQDVISVTERFSLRARKG